jgi:hypothetical protein
MMQVFEQAPRPALRPFIRRFLVVEFPSFHCDAHLPDTSPVAAFSFRGECRIDGERWAPPAAFTGLRETLRAHEHCREHAVAPESAHPGSGDSSAISADAWPITALLFLEAYDLSEAAEVAESHPALRYGSKVEVRPWAAPVPSQ